MFFRYYDEKNYYVLKFNNPEEPSLILAKKSAGIYKEIAYYSELFDLSIENRFFLIFEEDLIHL